MSVSAVSSNMVAAAAPHAKSAPAAVARAPDGDYKTPTAQSSKVKDSDGDYKSLMAAGAAKQSTPAVQSALATLKVGG